MSRNHPNTAILYLSLPLSTLVIFVSCVGLFTLDFYSKETLNWQAQSTGQDKMDLFFITPCLLITSLLAYRNNKTATLIWGGVVLYLTYTFVLYCFEIHFNKLFVPYCFCLGLSFYSLIFFLIKHYNQNYREHLPGKSRTRFVGYYFIIIAVLFYFVWLSEIIPATFQNKIPKSVSDSGLFTNGVQVIDLALVLPAIFVSGIFLLKRISTGIILAPVILTFFVLMDITIGLLAVEMKIKGVESNLILTGIMSFFALVSLFLLIWYLKRPPVR
jgi:hypothetical protein